MLSTKTGGAGHFKLNLVIALQVAPSLNLILVKHREKLSKQIDKIPYPIDITAKVPCLKEALKVLLSHQTRARSIQEQVSDLSFFSTAVSLCHPLLSCFSHYSVALSRPRYYSLFGSFDFVNDPATLCLTNTLDQVLRSVQGFQCADEIVQNYALRELLTTLRLQRVAATSNKIPSLKTHTHTHTYIHRSAACKYN